jgi:hydroxyacylglutathione hydrolase
MESDPESDLLPVLGMRAWRSSGREIQIPPLWSGELPQRIDEMSRDLPKERPVAVICGSGYRSSVSASLLRRHGYRQVRNVLRGMEGWKKAGFEMTPPD